MTLTLNNNDIAILIAVGGLTAFYLIWKSSNGSSVLKKASHPTEPDTSTPVVKSASAPSGIKKKSFLEKITNEESPIDIVFFYGSQTGTAEDLANRFSKDLATQFKLNSLICDLDEYEMSELFQWPEESFETGRKPIAIFMMATYGEAEPTDNAIEFYNWLMKGQGKGDDDGSNIEDDDFLDNQSAQNLQFMIFGLGNKTYEHFNAMSRRIDKRLRSIGATRIGNAGEGDDDGSLEDDFIEWKNSAIAAIGKYYGIAASASKNNRDEPHKPDYELIDHGIAKPGSDAGSIEAGKIFWGELSASNPRRWDTPLESPAGYQVFIENKTESVSYDSKHPYYATLSRSKTLYNNASDKFKFSETTVLPTPVPSLFSVDNASVEVIRQCLHLEIDTEGSGLKYETGDHVGVFPQNSDEEVLGLATVLGIQEKLDNVIELQKIKSSSNDKLHFSVPTTIRTALTYYLDLRQEVKQHHFEIISKYTSSEAEKLELYSYVDDREKYISEIEKPQLNLKNVLQKFPNVKLPVAVVLGEILSKSIVRYYSISSSALKDPKTVGVTSVIVRYAIAQNIPTAHATIKEGLATSWLQRLHEASVNGQNSDINSTIVPKYSIPMFIRTSTFRLPKNPETPVIMVGPGTGVAPFRGFVQERFHQASSGIKVGPTILFFGCRHPEIDFMYKEEFDHIEKTIEQWKISGASNSFEFKLVTAFSRTDGQKVYVQHRLAENSELVWDLLNARGGSFYVCGDAKNMAKDVQIALQNMAKEKGGKDEEGAKQWTKSLRTGVEVEVEPDTTIASLKQKIKDRKSPEFDSISADRLTLVRVLPPSSLNGSVSNKPNFTKLVERIEALQRDGVNVEADEENRLPMEYKYEDETVPGFGYSYKDEITVNNSYWAKVMNSTYRVTRYDLNKDMGSERDRYNSR
ncbi:hypothetical protein HK096_008126 [Nowakowskiella sp. JEL0078]|nr:hypothetical protein HK096_008126 [Nowakowskiella sp. JEL0078]